VLQPRKDKFLVMVAGSEGHSAKEASSPTYWADLEENHRDKITEKRLKCVFTVNPASDTSKKTSGKDESSLSNATNNTDNTSEQALVQANERIKKLEILLAETKRSKGTANKTSGIVPFDLASQLNMVSSPQSMFPPLLVILVALLAFFIGWLIK
jgi:hypothetical protein